ncbi:MAG: HAMP domain-containing histidine kinase [Lachnospiraceae bacterium]|nr:HAMP domain-containing histidine kinase [Butyrivibrio sp.]MCM1343260.1 HAMP domain-containing histidine kinase [Muribaculaceae bacterium]MCM1412431.1 HAMP domain-containing histidine kinase [Lachnospiraceae bacterium]
MEYLILGTLCALTAALAVKIHLLKKGLQEIDDGLEEILSQDTNRQITLSSRDRSIRRLASRLNVHLGQLRKSRLKYQNGDRELKEAITNISHDLRTPLTAISGYLELLEKKFTPEEIRFSAQETLFGKTQPYPDRKLSSEKHPFHAEHETGIGSAARDNGIEEALRCLAVIRNRTEHMKQLTEELFRCSLALSVPEEEPQLLSLNHVLEESLLSFYEALRKKRITPAVSMPETPVMRTLDPAALSRVFQNVLSNAVKYSGGDLSVCLTKDGAVTCSNTAPNLDPLLTEQLFDRYFTVETVSSPNAGSSTGLGLSIARLLTERMGGEISAVCVQQPGEPTASAPHHAENRLEITIRFPA